MSAKGYWLGVLLPTDLTLDIVIRDYFNSTSDRNLSVKPTWIIATITILCNYQSFFCSNLGRKTNKWTLNMLHSLQYYWIFHVHALSIVNDCWMIIWIWVNYMYIWKWTQTIKYDREWKWEKIERAKSTIGSCCLCR